jgi:hypothetical protein
MTTATKFHAPMSAALAIAFGSTRRTFGADEHAVCRTLAARTGRCRVAPHGPALAAAMARCAEHVRAQLPAPLLAFDGPPDFGDIADCAYLARVTTLYGPTVALRPLPEEEAPNA